ncbi:MAG: Rpn family recombination-promoting nuclease/putative transposase [Bacillota bacterium]|nr:Rpn family recombination-promoting nuclease/putative transposase [Bacillota bacterium]
MAKDKTLKGRIPKELEDMTLLDRFLFSEAIEDKETMELMLGIILGEEVELKEKPQAEKEERTSPGSKRVVLDVLGEDINDILYNIESQKEFRRNLPKRSRYYEGIITIKRLKSGETDYGKVQDVCMIMVMPFDLFGKGSYKYTFQMSCDEFPDVKLEDGATRIFLNTRGTDPEAASEELIALLKYIENTTDEVAESSGNQKIMRIHEKIKAIKANEDVGVRLMNAWEEKQETLKEGLEIGSYEKQLEIAKRMKAREMNLQEIADITGLPEEEIKKLS